MDNIEQIKLLCALSLAPLEHVAKEGPKKNNLSIPIDCSTLADLEALYSNRYKAIFNIKYNITGPALYWFEIESQTETRCIIENINKYKLVSGYKAVPAIRKSINHDTKILYVGKVKRDLWGRIVQHLGFYHVNRTQGLQLVHWCSGLDLNLILHIYEFEDEMAGLMPIIENGMAKHLNPLLGKHLK